MKVERTFQNTLDTFQVERYYIRRSEEQNHNCSIESKTFKVTQIISCLPEFIKILNFIIYMPPTLFYCIFHIFKHKSQLELQSTPYAKIYSK